MKKLVFLFLAFCFVNPAFAAVEAVDYKPFFKVDLNQQFPDYDTLVEKYKQNDIDRGYKYTWNIGNIFKAAFRQVIASYGNSDQRLKTPYEDGLLEAIQMMPKSTYPYIGPVLHTIPGMSEKITNLPGIKETKHQFPTRIAPQLQGIPDLEFLSPSLYFVLMPEAWPENARPLETPVKVKISPKAPYDKLLFEQVTKIVPPEDYTPANREKAKSRFSRSSLRTLHPTENSLITLKDAQAVSRTFSGVAELSKDFKLFLSLLEAGDLLDAWEQDNGKGLPVPVIKDMANPCKRLVLKFRIIGQESKLAAIAAKEGFNLNEWAYTCDKTVKAYRAATMSRSTMASLKLFKSPAFKQYINQLPPINSQAGKILMEGITEMYDAPLSDVVEILKSRKEFDKSFEQLNQMIIVNPIRGLD